MLSGLKNVSLKYSLPLTVDRTLSLSHQSGCQLMAYYCKLLTLEKVNHKDELWKTYPTKVSKACVSEVCQVLMPENKIQEF